MNTDRAPGTVRQNVVYSVLDYISQPAMVVMTAPVLLRTLGVREYGTWMLVNSIAAIASGLGGGFGDSATKFISMYRGRNDQEGVSRSFMGALTVNFTLGSLLAIGMAVSSPLLIRHIFKIEPAFCHDAIIAVRISAGVLLLRFVEVVCMSAVRAYERYRPVVVTSVSSRVLVLAFAMALAVRGYGLIGVLWATLAIETVTLIVQATLASTVIQFRSQQTSVAHLDIRELVSFGTFTWLKSAISVLFGHLDRLMVAALLGTGPLAFYVLCSQLTQVIPALLAAGFNFLFPNFSARIASGKWTERKEDYGKAAVVAACLAAAACVPMICRLPRCTKRLVGAGAC